MKTMNRIGAFALAILAASAIGCGGEPNAKKEAKPAETAQKSGGKKVDDHAAWWCGEHGIPEDECSMSSRFVAVEQ